MNSGKVLFFLVLFSNYLWLFLQKSNPTASTFIILSRALGTCESPLAPFFTSSVHRASGALLATVDSLRSTKPVKCFAVLLVGLWHRSLWLADQLERARTRSVLKIPPPSDSAALPRGNSSILAGCWSGRGVMTGAPY